MLFKFLIALLVSQFLSPSSALAGTVANCPPEPETNVPIASGDIYEGTKCTLNTPGDSDTFVFKANSGDTYHLATAINSGSEDICLTLYGPNLKEIAYQCTNFNWPYYQYSAGIDQKLSATGTYTMEVSERSAGAVNYAVSLERLNPFPPNEKEVGLDTDVTGNIVALTDSNAFIFTGATTGLYEVSATLPGNTSHDLCMTLYAPDGSLVESSALQNGTINPSCTNFNWPYYKYTVDIQFIPPKNGTYMAFLMEAGNHGTAIYNLEVSCLAGTCPKTPPLPCTLDNTATYNATSSTLAMQFTVGTKAAATWNAWLTSQNKMALQFSVPQPITNPPVVITKNITKLSKNGQVGVLSTLTTPTQGVVCSSWNLINTGTP